IVRFNSLLAGDLFTAEQKALIQGKLLPSRTGKPSSSRLACPVSANCSRLCKGIINCFWSNYFWG
ncbi:MAG TPA: hypothetical protein PLT73_09720, partial [Trichococcus flocculiformis]|nr:hypothetical protein [Trichococcus flocculiformis]